MSPEESPTLGRTAIDMKYLKVYWRHDRPKDPIVIYSEIDEHGWENRKVELFLDGRADYADPERATGETWLSLEPLPTLASIAAQGQFEPVEISREEFETEWNKAVGNV
jgi:hypothetical protein